MSKIANSVMDLIGGTPLLQLNKYCAETGVKANIIAKLEYLNPLGSVKDRVAYAMISDAEEKGFIFPGKSVIIEPTSGNTGIGLASVCAAKGYRIILTMPETMSLERRNLLKALGAELVLTPGNEGMKGSLTKAELLASEIPGAYIPQQFGNPINPAVHMSATGPEIWSDSGGNVDIFVSAVGTGGTITGVGAYLKEKKSNIKIYAVEPFESAVLSGEKPGSHNIQGIGAGFIPKILDQGIYDGIIQVKSEDAFLASRIAAKTEGLLIGMSSGVALHASVLLAREHENTGKNIVVIFCDSGERYLSTQLYITKE